MKRDQNVAKYCLPVRYVTGCRRPSFSCQRKRFSFCERTLKGRDKYLIYKTVVVDVVVVAVVVATVDSSVMIGVYRVAAAVNTAVAILVVKVKVVYPMF